MRFCVCLWGGVYNPIIPVFRPRPKEWRKERLSGAETARGYVEFFEPEAFVEAKPQLLERIGLERLRKETWTGKRVAPLDELVVSQSYGNRAEPEIGLGIIDALRYIYENEQRFALREKRPAYLVRPERGTGLVEALFGSYPSDQPSEYIPRTYEQVFEPTVLDATPETWLKVYEQRAVTPLRVTGYHLRTTGRPGHRVKFYVFNPNIGPDLIDLWNLRLEERGVYPIPIDWLPDLADQVREWIAADYRVAPAGLRGGSVSLTTIEFARSVGEGSQQDVREMLSAGLPRDALAFQSFRTPIWERRENEESLAPVHPLRVTAKRERVNLAIRGTDPPSVEFEGLSPDFASAFGHGYRTRWVNVVSITSAYRHEIATVFPFNVVNPVWPMLDHFKQRVVVGREGWSFGQNHTDSTQRIDLLTQEEAIVGFLKQRGVEASLSDPGHIGKEILQQLDGIWGTHLIADPDTLRMLNEMAGGMRRRREGEGEVEEVFDRRVRSESQWKTHLKRRHERRPIPEVGIEHFTKHKVIRLGLSTKCPRCTAANWHSLSAVDYMLACERCLERYAFPQGALKSKNENWSYRAIGPFSTPDYARGSYGSLLALNVLSEVGLISDPMAFSQGLMVRIDDGSPCEVDYVALRSKQVWGEWQRPELVVGEAKSFGAGDLIKQHDLAQLCRIGRRFPDAILVISVMRDEFTEGEKRILLPFVKWARRLDKRWMPSNPVILLTGVEIFFQISIGYTWEKKGGRHAEFAKERSWGSLRNLAESTQAIYLDLPPFSEDVLKRASQRNRER